MADETAKASPRPWRVNGHSIEANDPDGLWLQNEKTGWGVVANLPSCPKSRMSKKNRETWDAIVEANAAFLVEAVNNRDNAARELKWADEKIHRLLVEKDDLFNEAVKIREERDRLRDIVRRLVSSLSVHHSAMMAAVMSNREEFDTPDFRKGIDADADLLREARAAIGEGGAE